MARYRVGRHWSSWRFKRGVYIHYWPFPRYAINVFIYTCMMLSYRASQNAPKLVQFFFSLTNNNLLAADKNFENSNI